jgi:hydroxymethylglutaryl-CoA reductase (NADPH)
MAHPYARSLKAIYRINESHEIHDLLRKLKTKQPATTNQDFLPNRELFVPEANKNRLQMLSGKTGNSFPFLSGDQSLEDLSRLEGNIENYIGMTQVPTGIMGPVKVLGTSVDGEFYVPLATSEGALIASYHRGAKATRMAGGVRSVCLTESVHRSPLFRFHDLADLGTFVVWMLGEQEAMREVVSQTSNHAQLEEINTNIEGNQLIVTFSYFTGDASGQNMVTICTEAICQWMLKHAPVQPKAWYIEGNFSGDKKATVMSFTNVRGKKVSAEVELPREVVEQVLLTTPEKMAQYWVSSTIGIIQTGSIGAQGHYANGLAALFIATGQDAACVSEASVGITRMECTPEGNLYASVTLPNLIVGTIGGGTGLPTQRECLEMMDCYGQGKARKFAEIAGAVVLSGELSIAAALSAGHFTSAHQRLGRKQKSKA